MKYNTLGKSDMQISQIGFGCMSLIKATQQEAAALIEEAIDAGINYFDTADLYDKGENEQLLGRLLKPHRNKVIIATKVGNVWREDGSGWDWNPRKSYIIQAVDKSLLRLNINYIDVYQLHGGTIEDPIEETIEAFEDLVKQGKIRYYGISSIRPNVIRKYATLSNIQSVMMQYSMLDRRSEEEMLPFLQEHTISVLARGVLAQGLLINKPAKDYQGHTVSAVAAIQQTIEKELQSRSDRYSKTAIALQYVLSHPVIASAVTGFRSQAQLRDVLQAQEVTIPAEMIEKLKKQIPSKNYVEHRI